MPYVYKRWFLYTQYGLRKDGDIFKIGDSAVVVDRYGDITIKEKEFRGSEGLWDLLTRKGVNKEHVTSDDLGTYKKVLLLTNAHLERYQPGGVINVSRGKSSAKLSPPFREAQKPRCRIGITPCPGGYLSIFTKISARALY